MDFQELLDEALFIAVSIGAMSAVRFLDQNGADVKSTRLITQAALNGNLELVQYLVERGAPVTTEVLAAAVGSSSLDLVRYIHELGVAFTDEILISTGELSMIRYFWESHLLKGRILERTLLIALYRREFTLVRYLLKADAPVTTELLETAARLRLSKVLAELI